MSEPFGARIAMMVQVHYQLLVDKRQTRNHLNGLTWQADECLLGKTLKSPKPTTSERLNLREMDESEPLEAERRIRGMEIAPLQLPPFLERRRGIQTGFGCPAPNWFFGLSFDMAADSPLGVLNIAHVFWICSKGNQMDGPLFSYVQTRWNQRAEISLS